MKLKFNFDIKHFLGYIFLILLTSLGITAILIALPLTERISEKTSFDLITKDNQYWSKEYILQINTTNQREVDKIRDVIYRRLDRFGVERMKVIILEENVDLEDDEKNLTILQVVVNTTKDENLVKELIGNRFEIEIVAKKEDVDFFDQEDQFAYLFAENYDPTGWTREDFRNVHVTELKTADNTYSYFAIFKPWPNRQGEFNRFVNQHRGEYLGVNVDGFVTPYLVPLEEQGVFAVPLTSQNEEEVRAISILYNSGVIPVQYLLVAETDLEPNVIRVDHIGITVGFALSLVLTYAYLALIKHHDIDELKKAFLGTILTISIYIAVLKILNIPIDTFLLPINAILTFLLIKILVVNLDSVIYIESGLILVFLIIRILGTGYVEILATHLISLVILSKFCIIVSGWYLDKVKEI
jgi:hypothetical protein